MARRMVNIDRNTPLLLPPSIQDWVADDDMARLVVDAVALVSEREMRFNWKGTGSEQYPPQMMLALLVFCYSSGIFSSRRIERATHRDVAVRFITGDTHPDHDTIARFRRENGPLFKACFTRVLELAREMNIKRIGAIAIDGTKLQANASRKRVRSWQQIRQQLPKLDQLVEELAARAEKADAAAAADPADGERLPGPLAQATQRRDALRQAMISLEEKTRRESEKREAERRDHDDDGPGSPPRALPPEPRPQDTTNLTDPDAKLLPGKKGGYHPGYNAQLAVQADSRMPLILATAVCDHTNDRRQLAPMIGKTLEHHPETDRVLVDSGYDNSGQIHRMEKQHRIVIYCPPEERKEAPPSGQRSKARQCTADFRTGMHACLRSSFGQTVRQLRATTVEPVIGWIKETLGFRRFHLRGEAKVGMEWELVCLAFNLSLIHRLTGTATGRVPA